MVMFRCDVEGTGAHHDSAQFVLQIRNFITLANLAGFEHRSLAAWLRDVQLG